MSVSHAVYNPSKDAQGAQGKEIIQPAAIWL